MSDLATRAQNQSDARAAVAANTPAVRLKAIQQAFKMREAALTKFTGSPAKTAQLVSVLVARISRQPELLSCDPLSLYIATQKIAAFGLSPLPERKHFYLVPYNNNKLANAMKLPKGQTIREAQFQISYHGMVFLARSHPEIEDVWADVVYRGEPFSYDRFAGTVKHEVGVREGRSEKDLVQAYAVVRMRSGRHVFEVLSRDQVLKRRAKAQSGDFWNAWPDEMWKKTAVRALLNSERVPKSDGLAAAVAEETEDAPVPVPVAFTVHDTEDAVPEGGFVEGDASDPVDDAGDADAVHNGDAESAQQQEQKEPPPNETVHADGTVTKKPTERDLLLERIVRMAKSVNVQFDEVAEVVAKINNGHIPETWTKLTVPQMRHVEGWLRKEKGAKEPQP